MIDILNDVKALESTRKDNAVLLIYDDSENIEIYYKGTVDSLVSLIVRMMQTNEELRNIIIKTVETSCGRNIQLNDILKHE